MMDVRGGILVVSLGLGGGRSGGKVGGGMDQADAM